MDAMKEALKRKMDGLSGGISIEIHPLNAEEEMSEGHEEKPGLEIEPADEKPVDEANKSPDMAPQLDPGAQDKLAMLKGIADKQGNSGSLGQKAAMGAKAKIAEMLKKK